MKKYNNAGLVSIFKLTALILSIMVTLTGSMVLIGWFFNITFFKSFLPNYVPMKPNSAVCFIVIGISLLLQYLRHPNKYAWLIGKTLAFIVVLFGLLTSLEFIFGINFHIGTWLINMDPFSDSVSSRPAQWATLSFILIGLSLLLIDAPYMTFITQFFAFIIGMLGLLILTGYVFSFHSEVMIPTYSHSSIYTGLCLILVSLALVFLRPARGVMSLFISNTDGGMIARRLIPIVIIVPVILGYLRIIGQHYDIYAPNSGLEFYSILITATLITITTFVSDILRKSDQKRLEIEEQLRHSNRELNDLYNLAPCGYHSLDRNGTIIRMNQTELNWLGYTEDEVVGKMKITELLAPDDKRGFARQFEEMKRRGYIRDTERNMVRKDGSVFTVSLNALAVNDDDGNFIMTRSTVFDISERKRIERELRVSEERFHNAMDTAPIGMAIISLDGKYVEVNQALCQLLGYGKDELLNMKFHDITHPDDLDIDLANSQKLLDAKIRLNQIEKRYIRKNGEIIWVQLTASVLRDTLTNEPLYFITQVEDITDRKLIEERIRHLAYHDSLTNLPNRRLLLDRLTIAMDFAKRHQNLMALMFLDLDRFKNVNDTLGHDVGDELLKAVAVRLNTALRSVDTIARISGDEFVIILNGLAEANEAHLIANKIIEIMNNRFLIHGHELHVSCSIGITLYPKDGIEVSDLMKKADIAMYTAKESGRNQYCFYH